MLDCSDSFTFNVLKWNPLSLDLTVMVSVRIRIRIIFSQKQRVNGVIE